MLHDDLSELRELEKLEWEVEMLHADSLVTAHEVRLLTFEKYAATHPDDPLVQESRELAATTLALRRSWRVDAGVRRRTWRVEQSCYGWRRDYGEWPSGWNLTDRLARDAFISRHCAEKRINRCLADMSNNAHLWATRQSRFDEVLEEAPEFTGWLPEDHLRYFVTADGMEALDCDGLYRSLTACYEKALRP